MIYVKEPGMIYDIFLLFMCRFNSEDHLSRMGVDFKKAEELIFSAAENKKELVPVELLPFFFCREKNYCFLTRKYLFQKSEKFVTGYNIDDCIAEISNIEQFSDDLFEFYFCVKNQGIVASKISMEQKVRIIMEHNSNDKLKFSLLTFFTNPQYYTAKLCAELKDKEKIIKKFHEQNYGKLMQFNKGLEEPDIMAQIELLAETDKKHEKNIYYSISFLRPRMTVSLDISGTPMIFAGIDLHEKLRENTEVQNATDYLQTFGRVVSEETRVRILELLFENEEMYTGEIGRHFSMKMPAIFYHLDMMSNANMLLIRNEGRKVFYRINKDYFRNAVRILRKYTR